MKTLIGKCYIALGEYRNALEHCRKALVIRNIVYGVDACHAQQVRSYQLIGRIYIKLGDLKRAQEYLTK